MLNIYCGCFFVNDTEKYVFVSRWKKSFFICENFTQKDQFSDMFCVMPELKGAFSDLVIQNADLLGLVKSLK